MNTKLRKALLKVFPYLFNGLVIYSVLEGGLAFQRAAKFTMVMAGTMNGLLGLALAAWYASIAKTVINNREKPGNEGWFKPTTNYMPSVIGMLTAIIAAAMGHTISATIYALGIIFVLGGVFMVKNQIKDTDER